MKLYALLIGINDYIDSPLNQCVSDAEKMEKYLGEIVRHFEGSDITILRNTAATKAAIISELSGKLDLATNDDVFLMYYSGHGAYEKTDDLFADVHNGMMECLVPYYTEADKATPGFLLADKEIRYLLNKAKNNPHIVTIFDCCHSGDMVRDLNSLAIKRLAKPFPKRNYDRFIFSEIFPEAAFGGGKRPVADVLPYKNHVHLAACLSSESAWEDVSGGVFTGYLLRILRKTGGRLHYQAISRWAKLSLQDITRTKQTPTISVQGEGDLLRYSPWLNLFPAATAQEELSVLYNNKNGWYITRGHLMGVREGMELTVLADGAEILCVVTQADLEFSQIKAQQGDLIMLKGNQTYPATMKASFGPLSVFLHNIDQPESVQHELLTFLKNQPNIKLVPEQQADFFLNLGYQMAWFSLPGQAHRPLAEQIAIQQGLPESALSDQLQTIQAWHHFDQLENPDPDFDTAPIKVEACIHGEDNWADVTDGSFTIQPVSRDSDQDWYRSFDVRITNTTNEKLYVGVLMLNSDFGITAKPFDEQVIELEPGQSKMFYDHQNKPVTAYIERYKELYNWKAEWFHYKFIINNFEDFSITIKDYLQPGLPHPITEFDTRGGAKPKGEKDTGETPKPKKWCTLKTTVYLSNPSFNRMPDVLKSQWHLYIKDKILRPFLKAVYPEGVVL